MQTGAPQAGVMRRAEGRQAGSGVVSSIMTWAAVMSSCFTVRVLGTAHLSLVYSPTPLLGRNHYAHFQKRR